MVLKKRILIYNFIKRNFSFINFAALNPVLFLNHLELVGIKFNTWGSKGIKSPFLTQIYRQRYEKIKNLIIYTNKI